MTILCIADSESSRGFRLSGIETREVTTREDVEAALEAAFTVPGVGIVFVTKRAAELARDRINEAGLRHQEPLVMEIPSR